jgi:DNA polymerase-3 subunit gamma/tau
MILIRHGTGQLLDVGPEVQAEMAEWSKALPQPALLLALAAFQKAAVDLRGSWHPALPLEMALIEACGERADAAAAPAPLPAERPAPAPSTPAPRPAGGGSPPKPASKTASTAAPPDRLPASSLSFARLKEQWPRVLEAAFRHDPRTQALLNSGRLLGLEGGALVLGFNSDLLREKMEAKATLALVRQCLEEVFGAPLGVRCVLSRAWKPEGEAESPGEAIEDGGMVATAVRDLGAQVVDVKPLPPEGS